MNWFGEPWPSAEFRAPVCDDDALRVDPPGPGETCIFCGLDFESGSRGVKMPHMAAPRKDGLLTYEWRFCHIDCLIGNVGG